MTSATPRLSRVTSLAAGAAALCLIGGPALAQETAAADYFLKIKGIEGDSGKSAADKGHKNEIEILSWSWGETQASGTHAGGGGGGAGKVSMNDLSAAPDPQAGKVSKVDAISIKQTTAAAADGEAEITLKGDPAAAAEEARKRPGRVKYGDITLKRGSTAATSGGVSVAAGDLDGDGRADVAAAPRDSASGLPTGKRQHKPFTVIKELDKSTPVMGLARPLDRGSVTLVGRFGRCAVGTRYPELELGGRGGPTYRLTDAVVTGCAASSSGDRPMESISFNYAKIEY